MYAHVVYKIGEHAGDEQVRCDRNATESEIKFLLRNTLVVRHGSLPKHFSYFELLRKTESHV